ncbi:hypothetical protein PCC7424_2677 [Gloeothece citriformis PCC 7424]|uniref:Uncharacterized protein n=1 Tax=Gloeothece citriformis (strain PCC 7424) TaxID=65393 RepID=B7KKX0_GLOC7|nr:nucleotide exchange factor GrpE [Gloeothece citriformis]ACK71089.1 hypothetical protein PCC7424_2677 [Gloeothece citriformis PCC 7424]
MTTEQLHSLITDLDRFLAGENSRLSWSTSDYWEEREQTRQLLLRVRAYLVTTASQSPNIPTVGAEITPLSEQWVEQMTSTMIAQINQQLAGWFDSLRTELDELRNSRESLTQEIQSLQQQYQRMIADFIQLLMKRSQDILQQQIHQTQETIAQQLKLESSALIYPSKVLEQLIQLQQHSDQLLTDLDTTFRTVFETLEQDLQAYSQSLSKGLERMHNLGQQGEAKLLAYTNRLTDQLEQSSVISPAVDLPITPQPNAPEIETIHRLTDLIEPEIVSPPGDIEQPETFSLDLIEPEIVSPPEDIEPPESLSLDGWYLGIDFGSDSLAAVLSKTNLTTTEENLIEEYPLYWSSGEASSFRLPINSYSSFELESLKSQLTKLDSLPDNIWFKLITLFSIFNLNNTDVSENLKVMTHDLEQSALDSALQDLKGVIFSSPTDWKTTYQSQLKKAMLATHLVEDENQIFFLEEAIATFLAHLPLGTNSELSRSETVTLVINSGATSTDIALVIPPNPLETLSYDDFLLTQLAYGGNTLEQDIFCQLIYPQWMTQLNPPLTQFPGIVPQPGKPEPDKREQLKQCLERHPIGNSFIEAAKLAKLILQQQNSFTSQLGGQSWTLQRHDLEKIIIRPFLDSLEEQIQYLLSQKNLTFDDIEQVILSGGTILSLWYSLSNWINEKFPQGICFHDSETEILTKVAIGLGRFPLFPNLVKTLN